MGQKMASTRLLPLMLVCLASAAGSATERPRLLFGPQDQARFIDRRAWEPGRTVYENLKKLQADPKSELTSFDRMQVCVLRYLLERDVQAAQAASRQVLERAQNWESTLPGAKKSHPGPALDVSRQLQVYLLVFDCIQPAKVFTEEEELAVCEGFAVAVQRLMERGASFNPYDYQSDRYLPDNWNTDRFAAVGLFALAFPEHANSAEWLEHARVQFEWQLDHALLPDGAWPEGTRYHGAVLRGLLPFVVALQRSGGRDYFADRRFKAMLESYLRLQSPRCATLGNVTMSPGISNANWENIWTSALARAAPGVARSDPAFAGRLMWGWHRAGAPFNFEPSPGDLLGWLFIDPTIKPIPQPSLPSEITASGLVLLRDAFETERESLFLLAFATKRLPWQHQHQDTTSFSLWAYGTPLAVDPGVKDYGPSMKQWYERRQAHNRVVFGDSQPQEDSLIVHRVLTADVAYIDAAMPLKNQSLYHRRILFLSPDVYVIWDQVPQAESAEFHMHVITDARNASEPQITRTAAGRRVGFNCLNDIALDVELILPKGDDNDALNLIKIENDPYPVQFHVEQNGWAKAAATAYPKWLRCAQPRHGEDFVSILRPRKAASAAPTIERLTSPADTVAVQMGAPPDTTSLYLGSQAAGDIALRGTLAVVSRSAEAVQWSLLDGTQLKVEGLGEVESSVPASLLIRSRLGQRAAEIVNPAENPVTIRFAPEWTASGSSLNVQRWIGTTFADDRTERAGDRVDLPPGRYLITLPEVRPSDEAKH